MLKDLLLHIRYPYSAGVISTIWLGTALLISIDKNESIVPMLTLNIVATTIIAAIGFSSPRK